PRPPAASTSPCASMDDASAQRAPRSRTESVGRRPPSRPVPTAAMDRYAVADRSASIRSARALRAHRQETGNASDYC
ncbi:hypothetical protein PFISCL1PPCAC_23080, partial [Pristionchus fissidentatus]